MLPAAKFVPPCTFSAFAAYSLSSSLPQPANCKRAGSAVSDSRKNRDKTGYVTIKPSKGKQGDSYHTGVIPAMALQSLSHFLGIFLLR